MDEEGGSEVGFASTGAAVADDGNSCIGVNKGGGTVLTGGGDLEVGGSGEGSRAGGESGHGRSLWGLTGMG